MDSNIKKQVDQVNAAVSEMAKKIRETLSETEKAMYDAEIRVRAVRNAAKNSGKRANEVNSHVNNFLKKQGYDAENMLVAFTSKSPLINLGIKYMFERFRMAKEAAKKENDFGIAEFRVYLHKRRERLQKQMEGSLRPQRRSSRRGSGEDYEETEGGGRRRRKSTREPKEPKSRKRAQQENEPEETTGPIPKVNIVDAEYEDIGDQTYAAADYEANPPNPPDITPPRLLNSQEKREHEEARERARTSHPYSSREIKGAAERKPNDPIITPPPPIVTPPPSDDFVAQQNAPKLLGSGKIRKRNAKGHFAKGFEEGNYVQRQPGVVPGFSGIAPQEKLEREVGDLKIVAVKINETLEKNHKDDKTKTDDQLDEDEENRIIARREHAELINSIKLLGPGKKETGLMKPGTDTKQGSLTDTITKTVGEFTELNLGLKALRGGAGLIKRLLGIGTGVEAAAGGVEAAGAAAGGVEAALGGAAATTAGVVGLSATGVGAGALIGITGAKLIEKVATKGASEAREQKNGVSAENWTDKMAEFLRDMKVPVEKPWWMPYGIWVRKVNEKFGKFTDDKKHNGLFKDWLLQHYPDIAKKTFSYPEEEKEKEQEHVDIKKPEQIINSSPKIADKTPAIKAPTGTIIAPKSTVPLVMQGFNGVNPASEVMKREKPIETKPENTPSLLTKNGGKNNMKMSSEGINRLKKYEGLPKWALKPFPDPPGSGKFSIGYGHQIQPGEKFTEITPEQATQLLAKDLGKYESAVNDAVKVPISQQMFDSLVDFSYNVGVGKLKNIASILNSGNHDSAQKAGEKMREYNKVPNKSGKLEFSKGLQARRDDEAIAFGYKAPNVDMAQKEPPAQGKTLLAATKDNEDKKADIASKKGSGGGNIIAPTNNQQNNTTVLAQQQQPHNTDNTYRDTRYRNSVHS